LLTTLAAVLGASIHGYNVALLLHACCSNKEKNILVISNKEENILVIFIALLFIKRSIYKQLEEREVLMIKIILKNINLK